MSQRSVNNYHASQDKCRSTADGVLARGRPVEALDAYRCARQWAPHNVVTAALAPCAQFLHEMGGCFMKLGRLADAELCYTTAVQLATYLRLQADWHWVRSCRANAIGDKKRCADEALACIAVAPSYRWVVYH
jgi:hypothetical protein